MYWSGAAPTLPPVAAAKAGWLAKTNSVIRARRVRERRSSVACRRSVRRNMMRILNLMSEIALSFRVEFFDFDDLRHHRADIHFDQVNDEIDRLTDQGRHGAFDGFSNQLF